MPSSFLILATTLSAADMEGPLAGRTMGQIGTLFRPLASALTSMARAWKVMARAWDVLV
ncbi:MAG TPA: hypothetical protein PKY77_01525 [Phycisphaerae bacterium]|nr:hypothetical protein [Phycisphaerae bacterium]HRY68035.1 hypothetical protein [Phycisphaerae bacterium]HSA28685.1 hypothetical protein [Phycisphaerae bacterium]